MSILIKTELDDIREIVAKHPEAWKKVLDDGDIYDDEKLRLVQVVNQLIMEDEKVPPPLLIVLDKIGN